MRITSRFCSAVNLNWSSWHSETLAGVVFFLFFFMWRKRERTCISVNGVFAILILWQSGLSGTNVTVLRQTADNTFALSHVFPLEEASIQGFVPLLFSISVFYHDLNWDFLHIPLLSCLTRLHIFHSSFFTHSLPPSRCAVFCILAPHSLERGALQGWLEPRQRQEETVHKSLGIYSWWRWDNLSLACYICMDTVPKKARCMKVIEREKWWGKEGGMDGWTEAGVHHLSWDEWEGMIFFSLKVKGQIYLFPWKLQWNFTEYFALMMRRDQRP